MTTLQCADCRSASPYLRLETHGVGVADIVFITSAGADAAITPKLEDYIPSASELCLQTLHLTPEQLWFLLLAGADPEVPTTAMTVAIAMGHTFARRASGTEWLPHGGLLTAFCLDGPDSPGERARVLCTRVKCI